MSADVKLRWSAVADCARKAVYEATVPADRDRTDRERRILWRGKSIGHDYGTFLKATYGPNAVWREVKVRWAFGVGHIDLFLRPTGTAIEVLSSAFASDEMRQRKLLQLVGYMEAYPRAKNGCLIVLNPSDFTEDRWPVAKGTETYEALVERMRERVDELREWRSWGRLPDRVCGKPNDAIGHFCRHAVTCFDGWEAPEPVSVVDDPEAIRLAADFARAKLEERAAATTLAEWEAERKTCEAKLAALDGVDGIVGDIRIGPYSVKRVHVQRSPSLDTKKARLAGMLNEEVLAEFMRPGASYWTTTIERRDDGAVPADLGDEAPWTDDDLLAVFEESSAA